MIYLPIPKTNNQYLVNNNGEIFRADSMRRMAVRINRNQAKFRANLNGRCIHIPVARTVYSCFVEEIQDGMVIDHINGNQLDNRVENLRALTHQQNLRSHRRNRGKTSKYVGICRTRGYWKVSIMDSKGKLVNKYFKEEEIALEWRNQNLSKYGYNPEAWQKWQGPTENNST